MAGTDAERRQLRRAVVDRKNGAAATTAATAKHAALAHDRPPLRPVALNAGSRAKPASLGGAKQSAAAATTAVATAKRAALDDSAFGKDDGAAPAPPSKRQRQIPKPQPGPQAAPQPTQKPATQSGLGKSATHNPPLPQQQQQKSKPKQKQKPEPPPLHTLDAAELDDPMLVAEYAPEAFEYMRRLEQATMPDPDYLRHQTRLGVGAGPGEPAWVAREAAGDYLLSAHAALRLLPESLFLAANLLDRLLSHRVVSPAKLRLAAVAALSVAAKHEEVAAPPFWRVAGLLLRPDPEGALSSAKIAANDVVGNLRDQLCACRAELAAAEKFLLLTLAFNVRYPGPLSFLRRCSKADDYDTESRTVARYLMEACVVSPLFLAVPPSKMAAASVYLSRRMLDRGRWTKDLVYFSGYSHLDLRPVALELLHYFATLSPRRALYRKYDTPAFLKAASFVERWIDSPGGREILVNGF